LNRLEISVVAGYQRLPQPDGYSSNQAIGELKGGTLLRAVALILPAAR